MKSEIQNPNEEAMREKRRRSCLGLRASFVIGHWSFVIPISLRRLAVVAALSVLAAIPAAAASVPSWNHPPELQTEGIFWREHWYERGLTNHNPAYTKQFRINSPEVVLHPGFGPRREARENGLMLIRTEENLFQITAAEFYAEWWGGHPGTANKRFTVNGRTTYVLPRTGTEDGHCTYFYPSVPLKAADLVNGWSAFQFAVDQGTTFWGHSLIENACVRMALTNGHPDLVKLNLAAFTARVTATPLPAPAEGFALAIEVPPAFRDRVARVDFQTWHTGYDDNGDTRTTDWHGFTKRRLPMAHAGSADGGAARVEWGTPMLAAQAGVAVRAQVYFKDAPDLVYQTAAATGLEIAARPGTTVTLHHADELPKKFWSRANKLQRCAITLDFDPATIERAELVVITWTGGAGGVREYFKLNGRHFPVAEGSGHEVQFSRLPVEPSLLRRGANTIELLSDTEHHGIEVILPGPALVVRRREQPMSNDQ
jgi:hypothetical protein